MNKDHVYRRRLLMLVDLLNKLPEERFDYSNWVGNDYQGKADLSCGSAACAMGWSCTIPVLRKAGLRLVKNVEYTGGSTQKFTVCLKEDVNIATIDSAIVAGQKVFGLNEGEFNWLFVPNTYSAVKEYCSPGYSASAKQVADHILRFVNERFPAKKR